MQPSWGRPERRGPSSENDRSELHATECGFGRLTAVIRAVPTTRRGRLPFLALSGVLNFLNPYSCHTVGMRRLRPWIRTRDSYRAWDALTGRSLAERERSAQRRNFYVDPRRCRPTRRCVVDFGLARLLNRAAGEKSQGRSEAFQMYMQRDRSGIRLRVTLQSCRQIRLQQQSSVRH